LKSLVFILQYIPGIPAGERDLPGGNGGHRHHAGVLLLLLLLVLLELLLLLVLVLLLLMATTGTTRAALIAVAENITSTYYGYDGMVDLHRDPCCECLKQSLC